MNDGDLTPVPQEEQLQKIDEAFEVEIPDASIDVPDPPVPDLEALAAAFMPVLALEEKLEAIADTQQNRTTRKEVAEAMVGVAKLSVWGMIGWFGFVALAITAYMVAVCFGIVLLPDAALLALVGTVAAAAVLGAVGKLVEAFGLYIGEKKRNSN